MEELTERMWDGAEIAEWCIRRLLQLHVMPPQFYTEPRTEEQGGLWADAVYEFPVIAVAVMMLFLLGNVLRSTLLALLAWLVTSAEHGAPQREQLRLVGWSLCWHGAAAGLALHSMQPMCTTADNKDDVELPGGLTQVGCEEAGHKYQPGLAPLLGPALVPMHGLLSTWPGATGVDEDAGSNTLAGALLGQYGASEWPAQRVPIRVHALFIWQVGAVIERALGWALGDYTFSVSAGVDTGLLAAFLALSYTSGNACTAVALILVRELAAAGVHASRFLSFLLSRCTASRSPQLRSVGQTVTILSSSGAWLAFVVLRVINVVCLLVSLALQKPADLAPAREVDVALVSIAAALCGLDAFAALRGAKSALFSIDMRDSSVKAKGD